MHKGEESEWFDNPKVAKAPLYPFRKVAGNDKDEKSWWNSNDSRTTEIFGYTYSELAGTNTEVLQRVRDMYEWSIPLRNSRSKAKAPKDMEPIDISKSQFFQDKAVQPFAHLLLSQSVSLSESPELAKRAETILEGSTDESFVAESSIETSPSEYSTEWFIDDEVERLVPYLPLQKHMHLHTL